MSIVERAEIEGTSPAGKTVRKMIVGRAEDGRIVVALHSAKGQFLGDCWMDHHAAHDLARAIQRIADQRKVGAK